MKSERFIVSHHEVILNCRFKPYTVYHPDKIEITHRAVERLQSKIDNWSLQLMDTPHRGTNDKKFIYDYELTDQMHL